MSRYIDHPDLKQAALRNLVEGGSAPFKTTHRSYILWCPRPDCRRQKLYVEKTTGMSRCFRCGYQGWANWVLADVYGRSPEDLNELLYGVVSTGTIIESGTLNIPDFWGEEEKEDALLPTEPRFPTVIARDPQWYDISTPEAAAGARYLERRGISLDVASQYGIGFNAADQRVLFPVIIQGELRGWQGRYIHETTRVATESNGRVINIPKVLTVGKLGKECFMFQDRLSGAKHAILTEGPVDAIKCHLLGGNVASMGKDVSPRQLDLLVRAGIEALYIGLDRDAAKEVSRIIRVLYGTVTLFRLLPPAHRGDLGDCTMEEVAQQFAQAEQLGPAHEMQLYCPMPKLWC